MHKTTQSVTYRVLQDRQARAERGLQEIPAHELQSSRIMSRTPLYPDPLDNDKFVGRVVI
jgi:hypothetical protein